MMRIIKYPLLSLCILFCSLGHAKEVDIFVQSVSLSIEVLESNLQTRDTLWLKKNIVGSNVAYMPRTHDFVVTLLFANQLNFMFSCHGNDQNYHCDSSEENKDLYKHLEVKHDS